MTIIETAAFGESFTFYDEVDAVSERPLREMMPTEVVRA
jgi:hypothetical protein